MASIDLSGYEFVQAKLMEERCIIVDENERILKKVSSIEPSPPSQRRAAEKITFPDMWTNTFCSRPLDGFEEEKIEEGQHGVKVTAHRKLEHEVGILQHQTPTDKMRHLTKMHYLASSNGLWGKHEVDFILFVCSDATVNPNPNEIRDHKNVSKQELIEMLEATGNLFTHWFKLIARDFLFG